MARGQRRADGVVGVGERARDLALVQVGGAQLDVAAVGLQPFVILGGDPVAEHVNRLGLAAEVRGELLGDEHVGAVGDLSTPSIVSWSVIVTKSMPRRLASS